MRKILWVTFLQTPSLRRGTQGKQHLTRAWRVCCNACVEGVGKGKTAKATMCRYFYFWGSSGQQISNKPFIDPDHLAEASSGNASVPSKPSPKRHRRAEAPSKSTESKGTRNVVAKNP